MITITLIFLPAEEEMPPPSGKALCGPAGQPNLDTSGKWGMSNLSRFGKISGLGALAWLSYIVIFSVLV
jgi:hypothetical protein